MKPIATERCIRFLMIWYNLLLLAAAIAATVG